MIKVFLKNFAKLTESYICWRLIFSNYEGFRLKTNSGADAYSCEF